MMPARGGNPNFTDDKLVEIIAYIRSIDSAASEAAANVAPTATPSGPVVTSAPAVFAPLDLSGLAVPTSISGETAAPVESTPVPTDSAVVPTENAASASNGEALYIQTCSGCHAADGSGVQYVAKPLAESTLLQAKDDAALLNFLINGDPALVPPHPYRGGYPELSDSDLQSVITYLHGLPTGK
jgi:cytochrome c5